MNLLSLFTPGSLLIWIPGLLLLVSIFMAFARIKTGAASQPVKLVNLGLYVLSLAILFYVPNNEINNAIDFANAIDESGETVTSYEDIPFQAKDAYRMTAMSEAERTEFMSYSGAEDRGPVVVDGEELIYRPERALAWTLLIILFVFSNLLIFQDAKRYFTGGAPA